MNKDGLARIRDGENLTFNEQIQLIIQLSIPAIMAQISSIVMEYIDASMVGRLGAADSASIGLVSTSTWLMYGLCSALSIGFNVQVAHAIGAGDEKKARGLVRQGLTVAFLFSMLLLLVGSAISGMLPTWLGGEVEIRSNASRYFLIFALALPASQLRNTSAGMLQCSGNMKIPSILHIVMCGLDVVFNAVLIFPTRVFTLGSIESGTSIIFYGAGLGVTGAALGTAFAELVTACLMLYFLLVQSKELHLRKEEHLVFKKMELVQAVKLSIPVALEQIVTSGAYIASTVIVAPLGMIAIATNSFAVTAESLCYMPGYGVGSAATTLIGQSVGAGRKDMTKHLGWLTVGLGMAMMTLSGAIMFFIAPWMIGLLSPVSEIRELGTAVLRIEAFAEPLYAASIVATGVFRGAGDTLIPCIFNLISMWAVRIPMAAFLAPRMGLRGVWIAMCVELCVRGLLFLIRMKRRIK